jgi:hypothetical protein
MKSDNFAEKDPHAAARALSVDGGDSRPDPHSIGLPALTLGQCCLSLDRRMANHRPLCNQRNLIGQRLGWTWASASRVISVHGPCGQLPCRRRGDAALLWSECAQHCAGAQNCTTFTIAIRTGAILLVADSVEC